MNRLRAGALLAVFATLAACADQDGAITGVAPAGGPSYSMDEIRTCGDDTQVALLAGQHTPAGTVTVGNDDENLYVTYTTTGGWTITETHLSVATSLSGVPVNKSGNPAPGQFAFKATHGPGITQYTVTVPREGLGVDAGANLVIAAHAVVRSADGRTETAWGEGARFVEKGSWAMYLGHEVQGCRPPPGRDVVVFNDINVFDQHGMLSPENVTLVTNLVDYTHPGARGAATTIWFDRGRNSTCAFTGECSDARLASMRSTITAAGYSITDIASTSGSLTSVPSGVKAIFLWNPLVHFTMEEVNALKAFAAEGGRVVFIGEWEGYYNFRGPGIAVENQFLLNLGAVMTNIGQAVNCGYHDLPATALRPHQITTGMNGVRIACASVIVPGEGDYPLFYDTSDTKVLAGVARINIDPITELVEVMSTASVWTSDVPPSSTGH